MSIVVVHIAVIAWLHDLAKVLAEAIEKSAQVDCIRLKFIFELDPGSTDANPANFATFNNVPLSRAVSNVKVPPAVSLA